MGRMMMDAEFGPCPPRAPITKKKVRKNTIRQVHLITAVGGEQALEMIVDLAVKETVPAAPTALPRGASPPEVGTCPTIHICVFYITARLQTTVITWAPNWPALPDNLEDRDC